VAKRRCELISQNRYSSNQPLYVGGLRRAHPAWCGGSGIQMMIETRGMIGKFTFGQLSATLVSALVLLGSADVVLILCARFAFGEKSRVYDDMVYEKVKFYNGKINLTPV
jgi:hypothetical protein